jgi:hypothetical protein
MGLRQFNICACIKAPKFLVESQVLCLLLFFWLDAAAEDLLEEMRIIF